MSDQVIRNTLALIQLVRHESDALHVLGDYQAQRFTAENGAAPDLVRQPYGHDGERGLSRYG